MIDPNIHNYEVLCKIENELAKNHLTIHQFEYELVLLKNTFVKNSDTYMYTVVSTFLTAIDCYKLMKNNSKAANYPHLTINCNFMNL
jgi:deoxyribodipyrimidine photolyase